MKISKPKRKKAPAKEPAGSTRRKAAAGDDGKEPTHRLNVDVPVSMYRQLRMKVAEKDTSISKAVIGLIENYVTRQ